MKRSYIFYILIIFSAFFLFSGCGSARKAVEPYNESDISDEKYDVFKENIVENKKENKKTDIKNNSENMKLFSDIKDSDIITTHEEEKMTAEFFNTDIKNIFKIFHKISGKNFAIDDDVSGKVTLYVEKPVPWPNLLEIILDMNNLQKNEVGGIIRIAKKEVLKKEIEEEELIEKSRSYKTEIIRLNYAKSSDIIATIEKIITKDEKLPQNKRGKITADKRTNTLIITDTPDVIRHVKDICEALDKMTPQVMIEAKIIEASVNFSEQVGIEWGVSQGVTPTSNMLNTGGWLNDTGVADTLNGMVGGNSQRWSDDIGGSYGYNMAVNFPSVMTNFGSIGLNFTRIAGTPFILNALLKAMEAAGKGKIISAPKIITLDNQTALIKQGEEYPYLERDSSGYATVRFKDIEMILEVTPHVTPDKRVLMNINIVKNDIGDVINDQQSFTTKQAKTELLIKDKDTVVIGGIIKTMKMDSSLRVPFLSDIPILGRLFKSNARTDKKEELIIFITPTIVELDASYDDKMENNRF